ncbi:hypothetical protein [Polyangium spumosum]|uniref:Outer membrane beta-barrel protein n=1 Tax=Polyangium spumosum TaxID=889282 RepID=A0A6N7PVV5_9BACT|nr:hypothetical protein [Polyangium spumosum]MRG96188.1 hypothetical protein [Polyangium spumosum]
MFRTTLALSVSLAALLVAEAASAQTVDPPAAGRPVNSGFALQTSLISTPLLIGDDDLLGFPSFEGGLTVGYKFDRFVIGIGFDFSNWSDTSTFQSVDPNTGQEIEATRTRRLYSFVVAPEFQFALARSSDRRAELFGAVSVGLGTWDAVTTRDPEPAPGPVPNDDLRLRVRWRAAPGVRYWVHPHVAMSLVTGISGNYMITEPDSGPGGDTIGLTALYTQIGLLGVF